MIFATLLTNLAVQALGWSLLHFFWQGAALALLLWMFRGLAPSSPRARHAAACLVMLLMPVALITTFAVSYPAESASTVASVPPPVSIPHAVAAGASANGPAVTGAGLGLPSWAVCVWLAGVLALSVRAAGGWISAQNLKRRGTQKMSLEWTNRLARLMKQMKISRPVQLYTSAIAEVPTVVGWIRPAVLLPLTVVTGLSEAQIEAILAHELAHIRRHDYLVNLIQSAIETLLFYHPAVWCVGRQIRQEREHCCDDIAVAVCGNAIAYAGALTELEEIRGQVPEPALAATGGDLLRRIRRVLGHEQSEDRIPRYIGTTAVTALILAVAGAPLILSVTAAPQQSDRPKLTVTAPAVANPPAVKTIPPVKIGLLAQATPQRQAPAVAAGNDQSTRGIDLLLKLYASEKDSEMRRSILGYLGASDDSKAREQMLSILQTDPDMELRRAALGYVAAASGSAEKLINLYDGEKDSELRRSIMGYIGASDEPKAREKMLSILRTDTDPELRHSALGYVAAASDSAEKLINLYDGEKDTEIRRSILGYLGASDDPKALAKLLSIVQSDSDVELRRSALGYIAAR